MSTDTQEELPLRNRIVNCFNGNRHLSINAIDNLEELINSQINQTLDRLKEQAVSYTIVTENSLPGYDSKTIKPLIPLEAIDNERRSV